MKRSLLLALLLSLLLHLLLLGSGLLPPLSMQEEKALQPIRMQLASMTLTPAPAAASPAPAAATGEVQVSPQPALLSRSAVANRKNQSSAAKASASAEKTTVRDASAARAEASAPAGNTPQHEIRLTDRLHHKNFPVHAKLHYQVFYGAFLAGSASIDWQRDGERYRLSNQITSVIGQRMRYQSEGSIGSAGLKPENYTAWRNDEQREHARFDWKNAQLEYGDGESKNTRLDTGAQDILSLIYQLALKGAAHPPVQITTGKQVYRYPLAPTGEAELDTGAGKIRALVFHAQGEDSQTEFWLAPGFANQPVRIIFTNSKMKLDLRVTDIEIDQSLQWHQPKQQTRKNNR
jgi:hypothetical protein